MDDDDSDRSSEATQFEILSRDRQDFTTVNDYDFDDNNYVTDDDYVTDDEDDVTELQTSHMEIDTSFQSETLGSGMCSIIDCVLY